ncbi:MAG: glycosyltransferase family 2 protein [Planctomycetes bacterium]|nr:glycosyltransferase family 2 protein [Planctomycetota bacterium]
MSINMGMDLHSPRVSVIVPVYNEDEALGEMMSGLVEAMRGWPFEKELLIVDDGSEKAVTIDFSDFQARVIRHPCNLGNGAAVKTGIRNATGEYCLILDGDGQHDPGEALGLIRQLSDYFLVIGARDFKKTGQFHRSLANRLLCRLASYMAQVEIDDLTSGFRAFRRKEVMELIHLFPNGFSCPTTMTMGMAKLGYAVGFQPIHVKGRVGRSKLRPMRDGVRFLVIILKMATLFSPMRIFLPLALLMGTLGLLNYLVVLVCWSRFSVWSAVMFSTSISIFMIGLLAEALSTTNLRRL